MKYVPVAASSGAERTALESSTRMVIEGKEYWLDQGTFYVAVERDGRRVYVVVDPPVGAEVPKLPEEAREMKVDGQTYWQFDRVFYKKLGDVYVVVPPPAPKA